MDCATKIGGQSSTKVTIKQATLKWKNQHILQLRDNHDFFAAEAKYYRKCYGNFTRVDKAEYRSQENSEKAECKDTYQDIENKTYNKLFDYVSQDILEKQKVCLVTVWLLSKLMFLPSHVSRTVVAEEIVELRRELAERKSDKDKTINFVNDACLIRSTVKTLDTSLSWPPQWKNWMLMMQCYSLIYDYSTWWT